MNDAESLTILTLRNGRLSRLIKAGAPAVLIRNEAFLITEAALMLDGGRGSNADLADWLGRYEPLEQVSNRLDDLSDDPQLTFSVVLDAESSKSAENQAFLAVAKSKGFEVEVDERRGKVRVRAGEARIAELEKLSRE